ncbi:MAG: type II toxin-antitoxin system Phd/YefM family antitoxin [Magnetococcales bacterium]|nr:type II toxin-antitoxin system Phd/YefM family antitoxin [Magnetococcales bacterium]MBF0438657.1 type II toxin-antitoxin system Phd/YefM family antitoxin [Magnetococcales bacterium]
MTTLSEIIPVSDLRQDAVVILKRLKYIESYEQTEEERLLLRRLSKGEQEIQSGQGYSLDDILIEANALLNNKL